MFNPIANEKTEGSIEGSIEGAIEGAKVETANQRIFQLVK
jgi:hypothetical protein